MLQHKRIGVNSIIYHPGLFGPVFGKAEELYFQTVDTLLSKIDHKVLVVDFTWTQGMEQLIFQHCRDERYDKLLIMNVIDPNYENFFENIKKIRTLLLLDYSDVHVFGYTDNFLKSPSHNLGYRYFDNFDFWMVFEQQKNVEYIKNTDQTKLYNCMMRIPKPSRFNMLCLLADAELLNDGVVTFSSTNKITKQSGDDFIQFIKPAHLSARIHRGYGMVKDLLPLRIPGDDVKNDGYGMNSTFTKAIQSTRLDVAVETETSFEFTQTRFVTEKIYRPICMSRPFICLAQPLTLKYLQAMGFKTFDECWSEDYDSETNTDLRIEMIVDQIKILKNKDINFWNDVQKICNHNRQHINDITNEQLRKLSSCQW
jgi:hypothetical protein